MRCCGILKNLLRWRGNLRRTCCDGEATYGDALDRSVPGKASTPDFRCCFDVSRQPLCFTGLDSRLWDANTAFCTLMGYTRMEISGLSLRQFPISFQSNLWPGGQFQPMLPVLAITTAGPFSPVFGDRNRLTTNRPARLVTAVNATAASDSEAATGHWNQILKSNQAVRSQTSNHSHSHPHLHTILGALFTEGTSDAMSHPSRPPLTPN